MKYLSNFPYEGKLFSIALILLISYFLYHEWKVSPYNRTNDLKPGTWKYKYYHGGQPDTIPADSLKKWKKGEIN